MQAQASHQKGEASTARGGGGGLGGSVVREPEGEETGAEAAAY